MAKDKNAEKKDGVKDFFMRFIEKVDKKMEERAKKSTPCCGSGKKNDKSCCG